MIRSELALPKLDSPEHERIINAECDVVKSPKGVQKCQEKLGIDELSMGTLAKSEEPFD